MIINYNKKPIEYSKFRVSNYPVHHEVTLPFMPVFRLNVRYRSVIREIRRIDEALS